MTAKAIIMPVPGRQPVTRYDRITDRQKGNDGQFYESSVQERNLTRAPGTRVTLCANPSTSRGGALNTGLDILIDNPYLEGDPTYTKDKKQPKWRDRQWGEVFSGKEQVLRQHVLEYKHNRLYGYYTNQTDPMGYRRVLKGDAVDSVPYFQRAEAQMEMNDGATVLNMQNPQHEILYYIAIARDDIANSYQEIAVTPKAKWYITREEEEAEVKQQKKQAMNQAISRLEKINDLGDDTIIKFVKAINDPHFQNVKTIARTAAYNLLDSFIRKGKQQISEFNHAYNTYSKTETRPTFEARAQLHDYLQYSIIYNRGAEFTWVPPMREDGSTPDVVTWNRFDEILDFLSNPKYQPEQKDLEDQLKAKLRL